MPSLERVEEIWVLDLGSHARVVRARLLELPLPTVAALRCHAFAGGGLLALAHDYRVMPAEGIYFGLPEVDVRIAFTQALTDFARSRLAAHVAHEALTSGRRYSGAEALPAGIAYDLVPADEILSRSVALAKSLSGKHPPTYGAIKARLYRDVLAALRAPDAEAIDPDRFRFAIELSKGARAGARPA